MSEKGDDESIDKEVADFKKQINKLKEKNGINEQQMERQNNFLLQSTGENPVRRRPFETFQPECEDGVDPKEKNYFPEDLMQVNESAEKNLESDRHHWSSPGNRNDQVSPRFTQEEVEENSGKIEWRKNKQDTVEQGFSGSWRQKSGNATNSSAHHDFLEDNEPRLEPSNIVRQREQPLNQAFTIDLAPKYKPISYIDRDEADDYDNPMSKFEQPAPQMHQMQNQFNLNNEYKFSSKPQGSFEKKPAQISASSNFLLSDDPIVYPLSGSKPAPQKYDNR